MFDDIMDIDTYMKCDIYNVNDKYHIEMDLPGFKRDDINIEFNHGYIRVLASKKDNSEENGKTYIKRERTFGIYKREFYVGNVDYSKIFAQYKDGVLFIEVLKGDDENDKKTIEIK